MRTIILETNGEPNEVYITLFQCDMDKPEIVKFFEEYAIGYNVEPDNGMTYDWTDEHTLDMDIFDISNVVRMMSFKISASADPKWWDELAAIADEYSYDKTFMVINGETGIMTEYDGSKDEDERWSVFEA